MYKKCKTDGHYKTGDAIKLRKITVDCTAIFELAIFKKSGKNGTFYAYQGTVIKPDFTTGYRLGECYGLPINSFYKG